VVRWLLNTFPDPVIILFTVGGSVALGLGAEWWLRRRNHGDTENNEMLSLTFEFVGIAYAILVGFVIVSVWETQQDARAAIAAEAATLEDFVVLDHVLEPADRATIEDRVTAYVNVVIGDELAALKDGGHSEDAEAAADDIFHSVVDAKATTDVQTNIQATLIESYKDLSDERTQRHELANSRIAGELWLLVLVSSVAMILLVAAFKGQGRWDIYATTIVSITIGLVLFALVALSYPFSGDVSVDVSPLKGVLHTIADERS
jgi:hypothetical protein